MRSSPSILEILTLYDQALLSLADLGVRPWLVYISGAVPFYTALLLFWNDMSTEGGTATSALGYAPLLTVLYILLQWTRLLFCHALLVRQGASGSVAWTAARVCHTLAVQAWYQAAKLVVLPIAFLCGVPLAGAVAYFRAITSHAAEGAAPAAQAARRAALQHTANWQSLLGSSVVVALVFLNVAPGLAIIPQGVRILTGYEGTLSRSGVAWILTPAFWAATLVVSWAVADPLLAAHYALRTLREETRPSGADLLFRLKRLAAISSLLLLVWLPPTANGQDRTPQANPKALAVSASELDKAMAQARRSPEYAWLRKQAEAAPSPTSLDRFFERLGALWERAATWIQKAFESIFPKPKGTPDDPVQKAVGSSPRWLTYGSMMLVLVGAAFVLFRLRAKPQHSSSIAEPAVLDLRDEVVHATSRAGSEWLRLAQEAASREEFRVALRAAYIGIVALLAEAKLVSAAPGKTNRDLEKELQRRSRQSALLASFASAIHDFERCWYGTHEAGLEDIQMMIARYHSIAAQLVRVGEAAA